MNRQNNFFVFGSLFILSVCLLTVSVSFAAISEKNHQLLTRELSQRIQTDLSDSNASVELRKIEQYAISKNEIGLKGEAICVAGENRLPLQFNVKINTPRQAVSEINYNFIENAADYAPTSDEDILMRELMTQISRDYKTNNIVIAIDRVNDGGISGGERKLTGIGEIRIGDLVWTDIKFDVALDADTRKAKKVVYTVEK
jgi:hypothetical protein